MDILSIAIPMSVFRIFFYAKVMIKIMFLYD